MRREHLGDVPGLSGPCLLEEPRRGDMARLAGATRERPVGHTAQERLQKDVLPAFRGARIVVASEHLFGDQRVENALDLVLGTAGHGRRRAGGK